MEERMIAFLLAKVVEALQPIGPSAEVLLQQAEAYAAEHPGPKRKQVKVKDVTPTVDETVIDHLYSLYPSKTIRDNNEVSTGKCAKDKVRLRQLLKKRSAAEIEAVIVAYVQERDGAYLKNFSTFLNNFPENNDLFVTQPQLEEQFYQDV